MSPPPWAELLAIDEIALVVTVSGSGIAKTKLEQIIKRGKINAKIFIDFTIPLMG